MLRQQAFITPLFCMIQTCFLQELIIFRETISEKDCHIQEACGMFGSKLRSCTKTVRCQENVYFMFVKLSYCMWMSRAVIYLVYIKVELWCWKPNMPFPYWWNWYNERRKQLFVVCLAWRAETYFFLYMLIVLCLKAKRHRHLRVCVCLKFLTEKEKQPLLH